MTAAGELGAMGVLVFGGRIEKDRAVEHRRIDEPSLALGIAACGYQSGVGFMRAGWFVIRRTQAYPPPKTLCRSRNLIAKTPPAAGRGPGELMGGRRRPQSTP